MPNTVTNVDPDASPSCEATAMLAGQATSNAGAAAGAAQGEVRLTRFYQHLQVDPACLDVLQALQTRVRVLATPPGAPSVVLAAPINLYRTADDFGTPVALFLAGLEPAVRRLLERADRKVRHVRIVETNNRTVGLVDPPPSHLPPPVAPALGRTYIFDQPIIDCVRHHERARILYDPTAVDPARLVAQVA
jgi:hypothetical protein